MASRRSLPHCFLPTVWAQLASKVCSVWGRSLQNTPTLVPMLESVVLTYPIHPLCGQSLPVVRYLQSQGRPAVVVQFPDGEAVAIPLDWTDRRPHCPPLSVRGQCPRLHPGSLVQLRARVDALQRQADSSAELDESGATWACSARKEPHDAGKDLPSVAPFDPASLPRRPRKPAASDRRAAPRQRGR